MQDFSPPEAARPLMCEVRIWQPQAAKSAPHTKKPLRTAAGSEESRREATLHLFPRCRGNATGEHSMTEHIPVIVGAARTPTGKFLSNLASFTAPQLGAIVITEAVRRSGIAPGAIDEVIMGNVVSAGVGQSPARQAAIHAGLPDDLPAFTVNKVCGSGLKAVMLAAQSIRAGDDQAFVAGGMESMSNAPYLLLKARTGYRMGDGKIIDAVVHDGLWCAFENIHMGEEAEIIAEKFSVTREEQDQYSLQSHQ